MSAARPRGSIEIVVSIVLIGLLVWWVDLGGVARLYRRADPLLLMAGLAVAVGDRLVMIAKWYPLVRVQGLPIPFGRALRVYLASNFASLFLPTSVGGDVVRAVALGRPHGATMEVAASIAMERVLGLLGVALILAIAVPLALQSTAGLESYSLVAGAAVTAVLLLAGLPMIARVRRAARPLADRLRDRPIAGTVARLGDAYSSYHRHPALLVGVGAASALEQFVPVVLYGLVAASLGIQVGALALVVAATLSQLLGRLPISISGLGVEEGAAVVFLGLFGLDPASALSLALGRRLLETAVFIPGAVFWKDLAGSEQLGDDPRAVGPGGQSVPSSGGAPTR